MFWVVFQFFHVFWSKQGTAYLREKGSTNLALHSARRQLTPWSIESRRVRPTNQDKTYCTTARNTWSCEAKTRNCAGQEPLQCIGRIALNGRIFDQPPCTCFRVRHALLPSPALEALFAFLDDINAVPGPESDEIF